MCLCFSLKVNSRLFSTMFQAGCEFFHDVTWFTYTSISEFNIFHHKITCFTYPVTSRQPNQRQLYRLHPQVSRCHRFKSKVRSNNSKLIEKHILHTWVCVLISHVFVCLC